MNLPRRPLVVTPVAILALFALLLASPASAEPDLSAITAAAPKCAEGRTCVGIRLHVVIVDGAPVQPAAWIAEQLEEANRHFEPAGVSFELDGVDALPAEYADIETRSDRDLVGRRHYTRGVVHVFLVRSLANVDDPGVIRGVHWRDRKKRSRRWVLLSSIAASMVLAHELGHFFSLPHSAYEVSIMNKTPRDKPPHKERTFHKEEVAKMKRALKTMLASKELRARPTSP